MGADQWVIKNGAGFQPGDLAPFRLINVSVDICTAIEIDSAEDDLGAFGHRCVGRTERSECVGQTDNLIKLPRVLQAEIDTVDIPHSVNLVIEDSHACRRPGVGWGHGQE